MKKLIDYSLTMKTSKFLIAIAIFLAVITFPGSTSAFSFVESIDDYGINSTGYNYISTLDFTDGWIGWGETGTWGHSLSVDYMTVPDNFTVAGASLEIQGYQYAGYGGEVISVAGTLIWTGLHGWQWTSEAQYSFDITNIDHSFWNSSPFYVSLTPFFEYGFNMTQSVLSVDYDFPTNPTLEVASTPEPSTFILVGLGLSAVGLLRKRKK